MNARFFIDNREIIGLWMVYGVAILLLLVVLCSILEAIDEKIHKRKMEKIKLQQKQQLEEKRRIKQIKASNRAKSYATVRAVMLSEV